jgi:NADP-dependent 3-hydroxy acid dehydrogenase YdfG
MDNIKDKVIVITGASSGMGEATARKLFELGAKVVLAARREDKLQAIVAELGANAMYVKTDVSKRTDLDNLIQQAIARFGQVDVLWNNAGIMPTSFFDEGKVEEWDRMIDVNIKGVLYGINAVLPHMLERAQGHIMTTSSMGGLNTFPSGGVYSCTKFGVRAMMDTLRKEVGETIKVTTLFPGTVSTALGHDITSPKVKALYGDFGNLPRMDPVAIANAVVYALSQPDNITINEVMLRPLGKTVN